MQPIQGLHHITVFASDPQRNVDFYHNILGQRLIKTTVNFDDPGTYHLYYADKIGTPGTVMTFFPWVGARRGRVGNGETASVAYSIREDSVSFWQDHLAKNDIKVKEDGERFGFPVYKFQDPDGLWLELIVTDKTATIEYWEDGVIPEEHALLGFHSVTLNVGHAAEHTAKLLTDVMGYTDKGKEGNRWRFEGASGDIGLYVDLKVQPGYGRGAMGAGSVHHIAFRTRDDSEQLEYQEAIGSAGHGVSPVRDRQYFHSIYFREPSGTLFEVATDAPGFLYDESVEELGSNLKLPHWYEPQREQIESILPPLNLDKVVK